MSDWAREPNEFGLEPLLRVNQRAVVLRAGPDEGYAAVAPVGGRVRMTGVQRSGGAAGGAGAVSGAGPDGAAGEMVAIVGESGAGKSSLLHLLAALDTAYGGRGLVWGGPVERDVGAGGFGVSEPEDGVCVAVSLSAAGVYCG